VSDYITDLARAICDRVPSDKRPDTGEDLQLFRIYAVLARVKGADVTAENVHDAWCAWMGDREPDHPSLVPYGQLDGEQQQQDEPFVQAIIDAAIDA
jgi:hypothetical protein